MKLKLSIFIFMLIFSVLCLQILSCKEKPQDPEAEYKNYYGNLTTISASIYDPIKHEYLNLEVTKDTEEYCIMLQSDIDKLKSYSMTPEKITIRATYSNNFYGNKERIQRQLFIRC